MMRMLPPVFSPMPLAALLGGIAGARRRDARELAARLIRTTFGEARIRLYDCGTSALRDALRVAAQHARNSPVALPAFGCFDLASAAVGAGVTVLPYDVDPETLAPEPASLEATLARGARVVVVAPLYGMPVDWDAIAGLAKRAGATIIEDAAQADGAEWRGQQVGSLGDLTVLSFGRGKGWSGVRGGALLVRAGPLLDTPLGDAPEGGWADDWKVLASGFAQWALARPWLYRLPTLVPGLALGHTVYRPPRLPERMPRAAAAILCRTRKAVEKEQWVRQYNARRILDTIAGTPGVQPVRPPAGGTAGYLRLPVLAAAGAAAVAGRGEARALGVACSYPAPLTALGPMCAVNADPAGRWPGAELLAERLITLPTHRHVRAAEISAIARLLGAEAGRAELVAPSETGGSVPRHVTDARRARSA